MTPVGAEFKVPDRQKGEWIRAYKLFDRDVRWISGGSLSFNWVVTLSAASRFCGGGKLYWHDQGFKSQYFTEVKFFGVPVSSLNLCEFESLRRCNFFLSPLHRFVHHFHLFFLGRLFLPTFIISPSFLGNLVQSGASWSAPASFTPRFSLRLWSIEPDYTFQPPIFRLHQTSTRNWFTPTSLSKHTSPASRFVSLPLPAHSLSLLHPSLSTSHSLLTPSIVTSSTSSPEESSILIAGKKAWRHASAIASYAEPLRHAIIIDVSMWWEFRRILVGNRG